MELNSWARSDHRGSSAAFGCNSDNTGYFMLITSSVWYWHIYSIIRNGETMYLMSFSCKKNPKIKSIIRKWERNNLCLLKVWGPLSYIKFTFRWEKKKVRQSYQAWTPLSLPLSSSLNLSPSKRRESRGSSPPGVPTLMPLALSCSRRDQGTNRGPGSELLYQEQEHRTE